MSKRIKEDREVLRKIGEGVSATFAAFFNGMAKITFLKPQLGRKWR